MEKTLNDFKIDEIEEHLEKLGYSVVPTSELISLYERNSNHPG